MEGYLRLTTRIPVEFGMSKWILSSVGTVIIEQGVSGPTQLLSSPRKSVWCWTSTAPHPVPE